MVSLRLKLPQHLHTGIVLTQGCPRVWLQRGPAWNLESLSVPCETASRPCSLSSLKEVPCSGPGPSAAKGRKVLDENVSKWQQFLLDSG